MKNMLKRVFVTLLALSMIATPIQVHAEEVAYNSYVFSRMDNLTVYIPSALGMSYDGEKLYVADKVKVTGIRTRTKEYGVTVTTDETITFTNNEDNKTKLDGSVVFGTDGTETWDAAEIVNSTEKPVSFTILPPYEKEGTYSAIANFNISVEQLEPDYSSYFTYTTSGTDTTITGLTTLGNTWVSENDGLLYIPTYIGTGSSKTNVVAIGDSAFKNNTSVTSVYMEEENSHLTSLGTDSFRGMTNLTSVNVADTVTTINKSAFEGCTALTSIEIPAAVTTIGSYAFWDDVAITSVNYNANATVSENIFGGESAHGFTMTIGENVTSIPNALGTVTKNEYPSIVLDTSNANDLVYSTYNFQNWKGLTTLTLPNTLTEIPEGLCKDCTALTAIEVPEGVTTIGASAFNGCSAASSITIPSTTTSIEGSAFANCLYLRDIYYNAVNATSDYSIFTNAAHEGYSEYNFGSNTDNCQNTLTGCVLHIGSAVESIPATLGQSDTAIGYRTPLIVDIEWGTTSIELVDENFARWKLRNIAIPNGMTSIPIGLCTDCNNLKTISLPNSLTSLGYYAFKNCNEVTDIYDDSCCVGGTAVFCTDKTSNMTTATTTYHYGEHWTYDTLQPSVGVASVNVFGTQLYPTVNAIDFGNFRPTTIADGAFANVVFTETLTLPDSVTTINGGAFSNATIPCLGLSTNVTTIKSSAFTGEVEMVTYPETEGYKDEHLTIESGNTKLENAVWIYAGETPDKLENYFKYTLSGTNATITGFSTLGKSKNITELEFPETVVRSGVTYNVNALAAHAFENNTTITSVDMPYITTMNESWGSGLQFAGCTNLTEVNMPNVVTIGGYSFQNCTNLDTVRISNKCTNVNQRAFENDSNLSKVYYAGTYSEAQSMSISDTSNNYFKDTYAEWFYNGVSARKTVDGLVYNFNFDTNEWTVTGFAADATTSQQANLVIPDEIDGYPVTTIPEGTFKSNTNITSVKLGANCATVGKNAFSGCNKITSLDLGGVQSIGYNAFGDCSGIKTLLIPASCQTLAERAFYNCSGLLSIEVEDGCTSLDGGPGCFYRSTNVKTLILPLSLTFIGVKVFEHPTSITGIYYEGSESDKANMTISSGNNALNATWYYGASLGDNVLMFNYTLNGTDATITGLSGTTDQVAKLNAAGGVLTIPSTIKDGDNTYNVVAVGDTAFKNNSTILGLVIEDGVTSLGANSFNNCDKITGLEIRATNLAIGDSAFYDCDGLTSLYIPSGVTSIGAKAFDGSSNITSIYMEEGCSTLGFGCFENMGALLTAHLADSITDWGVADIYKNGSSTNGSIFYGDSKLVSANIPTGVDNIPRSTFMNCALTSIDIPSNITTIGSQAFINNQGLTSVYIPSSVETIGIYAYQNCNNVTEIYMEDGCTKLCYETFSEMDNLTTIHLADTISDMGEADTSNETRGGSTFWNDSKLVDVNIPASLTVIPRSCFGNCSSLGDIVLPSGLTTVGWQGFSCNSSNLHEIYVPKSLKTVSGRGFNGCSGLTSVIYEGSTADKAKISINSNGNSYFTNATWTCQGDLLTNSLFSTRRMMISPALELLDAENIDLAFAQTVVLPSDQNIYSVEDYSDMGMIAEGTEVLVVGYAAYEGEPLNYVVIETTEGNAYVRLSVTDLEIVPYTVEDLEEPVKAIVFEDMTTYVRPDGDEFTQIQAESIIEVVKKVMLVGEETEWVVLSDGSCLNKNITDLCTDIYEVEEIEPLAYETEKVDVYDYPNNKVIGNVQDEISVIGTVKLNGESIENWLYVQTDSIEGYINKSFDDLTEVVENEEIEVTMLEEPLTGLLLEEMNMFDKPEGTEIFILPENAEITVIGQVTDTNWYMIGITVDDEDIEGYIEVTAENIEDIFVTEEEEAVVEIEVNEYEEVLEGKLKDEMTMYDLPDGEEIYILPEDTEIKVIGEVADSDWVLINIFVDDETVEGYIEVTTDDITEIFKAEENEVDNNDKSSDTKTSTDTNNSDDTVKIAEGGEPIEEPTTTETNRTSTEYTNPTDGKNEEEQEDDEESDTDNKENNNEVKNNEVKNNDVNNEDVEQTEEGSQEAETTTTTSNTTDENAAETINTAEGD